MSRWPAVKGPSGAAVSPPVRAHLSGETATWGPAEVGAVTGSVYDWWSGHQRLFRALSWLVFGGREAELRSLARDRLLAGPGDRVLDVGCGPGRSFKPLAAEVTPDGRVVGVDYSEGMVRRAGERARTLTVDCEATRSDAARLPLLNRVSSWATDWHPETDVLGSREATFVDVETEVFLGGTTFVSVAEKREGSAGEAA